MDIECTWFTDVNGVARRIDGMVLCVIDIERLLDAGLPLRRNSW